MGSPCTATNIDPAAQGTGGALRIRYRVWKLRALCWVLRRLRAALIVVGVLLWLVNTYIPMDAKINRILDIVVVIAVVIWLLQAFGLNGIRIGH